MQKVFVDWSIICLLLAFIIYITYNISVLICFGVPNSLSETFYLFNKKQKHLGILFSIMLASVAGLLLPIWINILEADELQFIAFISIMCLFFTAFAPTFKNSDLEDNVHTISATISAIFSLIWIIFTGKIYSVIICFVIMMLIAFITKTLKKSFIYWLETVVFISMFIVLVLLYKK